MARTSLKGSNPFGPIPLVDPRRLLEFEASVARSLLPDDGFQKLIHNGGSSHTQLWWGPMVPVRDGDVVYYFKTPTGRIAVEAVHTPEGLPTLPTIS